MKERLEKKNGDQGAQGEAEQPIDELVRDFYG